MTNKEPWGYQEEEIRHETTGAIGARNPQGDIVYGPLAERHLTPIKAGEQQEFRVEEPVSPIAPANRLIDTLTPQAQLDELEKQRQDLLETSKERQEEIMKDQRGLVEKASDWIKGRSLEDKIKTEQERFQVRQTLEMERQALGQAFELQQRAINLVEQRDAAIAMLGQQTISTPFITSQQARIAENYDRRIASTSALAGAQSSYAQALQGNIQQARALIGDVVEAYTYDTQLELERINLFLELNRDEINMLDRDYQNALSESQTYWENQLKEEQDSARQVMEWSINHHDAGIRLGDTKEEAAEKLAKWLQLQPDADVKSLALEYPGVVTTDMTFDEALDAISKMPHIPDWELRTVGRDLYQVDPQTGETRLLARGAEATPTSYREWQLAGSPGEYSEWLKTRTTKDAFSSTSINNLAAQGIPEEESLAIAAAIRRGDDLNPFGDLTQEDMDKIEKVREEMRKNEGFAELVEKFLENY